MSIEMDNPETPLEMIDALTNWIEQMYLAHQTRNEQMFKRAHEKAGELGFELTIKLAEVTDE